MCLLTFVPAGVQPNIDNLYNGTIYNDDGHGYAIVAGDNLIVHKGLNAEQVLSRFEQDRADNPDGPALFHSRMSTHGNRLSVDNVHPFFVGSDRRTVLAHNGILPKNVHPVKGDHRSDTRIAAETFIPQLGSLRKKWLREYIQHWMTPFNKMVILTTNPHFPAQAFILNEREGIWDNGIWYSNDGYQPFDAKYTKYPTKNWWDNGDNADTVAIEVERGMRCDSCYLPWSSCDCYVPPSLRQQHQEASTGWPLQ